ncbi:alkaline phosphatase family protein [Vaginisenegalia massiliensis]|uniref:alkaline phosphatase family protein n=1 Tax=Vaginisenegalia massiliensis TaxID=2058294 RepID=UPI000F5264EC|nr:alkaline phosphatase family protein [Vaginisenegalia massiliensis]
MDPVIILSLSSLAAHDLAIMADLPHFKQAMAQGTLIRSLSSVSPSLPTVAQTSLITGTFPSHHGIIDQTLIEPEYYQASEYRLAKQVRVPSLFHYFKANGYRTASLNWPVVGKHPAIDYNWSCFTPSRTWQHARLESYKLSSKAFFRKMEQKFGSFKARKEACGADLDDYLFDILCYLLQNHQADFLAISCQELAKTRQRFGLNSIEAQQALAHFDQRLGRLMMVLNQLGKGKSAHVVIVGDQAPIHTHTLIRPNHLLSLPQGWQSLSKQGRINQWQVYCKATQASAYVYRHPKADISKKAIVDCLSPLNPMINHYYDQEELKHLGANINCLFMLEAKPGFAFRDDLRGSFVEAFSYQDSYEHDKVSSGWISNKIKHDSLALWMGPRIKQGYHLPEARLIDIAPTLARTCDLKLNHYFDGKILFNLFT